MTRKNVEHPPVEWITLDHMVTDPAVQRVLDERRAEHIATTFDPNAFGILVVWEQAENRYVIIDGQHRAHALRHLGWNGQKLPCQVFRDITQADAARVFLNRNTFKSPRPIDRFHVRLTAKDPIALGIQKVVGEAGYRISAATQDGSISAVRALEAVYLGRGQRIKGENPTALKNALLSITEAWGRTAAAVNGYVIEGVGAFFLRYADADRRRLAAKLAAISSGPATLIARGKGKCAMHGGKIAAGIGHYLTEEYNRGLRGNQRLPGWREAAEKE